MSRAETVGAAAQSAHEAPHISGSNLSRMNHAYQRAAGGSSPHRFPAVLSTYRLAFASLKADCCRAYSNAPSAFAAMLTTSFTTAVAFFATATSPVMPISAFGLYAATAVVMNYVLVMTVFPCLIMIWHNSGSKSCCCCNCKWSCRYKHVADHA
eukprot:SAG11_NODE_10163_length_850_cov_1.961385_2_plen_153_part_01